jgi:hypothetical protein
MADTVTDFCARLHAVDPFSLAVGVAAGVALGWVALKLWRLIEDHVMDG